MIAPLNSVPLTDIELALLLEAAYRYTGYDFRDYAPPTLKRRIMERVRAEGVKSVSGLQEKILHDLDAMERFVYAISVNPSSMFRDPAFFAALRERVVPMLRTFPFVRLWVVGASTGEEVYSLAVLLHEEGVYERCKIYATDVSELVVEQAKSGTIPADMLDEYAQRYRDAGGKRDLADYFEIAGEGATLLPALRENILFATHNLATDGSFNEFHTILARNVLTHYNKALAYRAHQVLFESLVRLGYLGLSAKETMRYTPHFRAFDELPETPGLFRRVR